MRRLKFYTIINGAHICKNMSDYTFFFYNDYNTLFFNPSFQHTLTIMISIIWLNFNYNWILIPVYFSQQATRNELLEASSLTLDNSLTKWLSGLMTRTSVVARSSATASFWVLPTVSEGKLWPYVTFTARANSCDFRFAKFDVHCGALNFTNGLEEGRVVVTSVNGQAHEDYNAFLINHDIALIHLPEAVSGPSECWASILVL